MWFFSTVSLREFYCKLFVNCHNRSKAVEPCLITIIAPDEVSKLVSQNLAKCRVLCPLFPENGTSSFKHLTILWSSLVRLPFHTPKCHIPVRVDRVDLLAVFPFHAHNITLPKAYEFLIHLILDSPLAFAWQIMILPARSARAKRDEIEVLSVIRHQFASIVDGNTKGIGVVRWAIRSEYPLTPVVLRMILPWWTFL